ncbi:MAG: hypothetical protein AAF220_05445, partial [Pseudomonadota bacterium]
MRKQPLKPAVPNVTAQSPNPSPDTETGSGDTTGRGIAFMLLCVTTGSMMDAMIKYASPTFGTTQIIFFRSLITLIPIVFMIWRSGGVAVLRSGQPGVQVVRIAFGVVAMFGFFFALGEAFTISPENLTPPSAIMVLLCFYATDCGHSRVFPSGK